MTEIDDKIHQLLNANEFDFDECYHECLELLRDIDVNTTKINEQLKQLAARENQ